MSASFELALEDQNRAVAHRPGNSWIVASRAVTKRMIGDKSGAIEDFEQAVSLDAFNWAVQGNLLIWDVALTDGAEPDAQRASVGLEHADAIAQQGATEFPFDVLLAQICAGQRNMNQVMSELSKPVERCLTAYFGGVRALSEGRTDDAATWFERSSNTTDGDVIFIELAQWQLARLRPR